MSSKKTNRNKTKKRPSSNNRRSPADKKRLPSTTTGPRRAPMPPRAAAAPAVVPAAEPTAEPTPEPTAEPTAEPGEQADHVEPVDHPEQIDHPAQVEEIDRTDPVRRDVTFTGPDPAAWAWLNTWPFVDEAAVHPEPDADCETRPVVADEEEEDAPADGAPWWAVSTPEDAPPVAASDTAPPVAVPAAVGRGRTRWLSIAVALLAATALIGLVWWNLLRSDDKAGPAASTAYLPPVHLVGDRAVVRTQVLASGDLRVTHWIHASAMVHSVALRLPTVAGVSPGSITVSHLVVASDGVAVPTDGEPSAGRAETLTLPPSHSVYLTYVLSGAVQHTSGPTGRALARLTSLEVTTDSTMPLTTHRVAGARVLALACSPPDVAALPHPCGAVQHGTWHVALARSEARERVMAQLDLS